MILKRVIGVTLAVVLIFTASVVGTNAESAIDIQLWDNFVNAMSFMDEGINNTSVFLRPTDRPDVSEFCIRYTENDGEEKVVGLGAYYNTANPEVFGYTYDQGVFDSGFAYDVDDKYFYTTQKAWQRQFGFTPLFDILAPLAGFDYVTRRIFFEYDGMEWMIQIWKGNYGYNNFAGGEVGIYNRPAGTVNGMHFSCVTDEEMMPISMKVYDEDKVYFEREPYKTWWMTGFVFSDGRVPLTKIHMDSSIEFPNEEMCSAFAQSAQKATGVECTVQGTTAYLVW